MDEDYLKEHGIGLKEGMDRIQERMRIPKANFEDRIEHIQKLNQIYVKDEKRLLSDYYTLINKERFKLTLFDSVMGIYDDKYVGLTGVSISFIHLDDIIFGVQDLLSLD